MADMLDRIGEPCASSCPAREHSGGAGGLGLGLFIAKMLLERSGAAVNFANSRKSGRGAEITVSWPRPAFEMHGNPVGAGELTPA